MGLLMDSGGATKYPQKLGFVLLIKIGSHKK